MFAMGDVGIWGRGVISICLVSESSPKVGDGEYIAVS